MISTYRNRNEEKRKRHNRMCLFSIISALLICAGAVHSSSRLKDDLVPILNHSELTPDCHQCHDRKMAMARWFEKHGSPVPEKMAEAVLKTNKPKIMAKIAVRETNGNPYKRKYGYKKAHDGAFGVNRNDWGKVSEDPVEQAIQAEMAYDTFFKAAKGNKVVAHNLYGGIVNAESDAEKFLADLVNVP